VAVQLTHLTDSELVQAARLGEKRAFEELLARHEPVVKHLATRMVTDPAIAQELTQEAILAAYLSLGDLHNPASFQSWLYGITLNTCRTYLRQRRQDFLSLDAFAAGLHFDALLFTSGEPGPEDIVATQELHALIREAVQSLSPKNRDAVFLYYYEQLNVAEISALLGISAAAVKGRLHKSREQLRGQLAHLDQVPYSRNTIDERKAGMIRVSVMDVFKQADGGSYLIVLLDEQGGRMLPIWVGPGEALNIALNLLGQETARPMTYRFMANLLGAANITLQGVRVAALQGDTFYAVAEFLDQGKPIAIDSRPSDAVALALYVGSPISVDEDVMARAGIKVPAAYLQQPERKGLEAIAGEFKQTMEEYAQARQAAAERSEEQRQGAQHALFDYLFGAAHG
jgi:RNA polymerase sigma factor (sigma-70 family)